MMTNEEIQVRAAKIKLAIFDVDGVFTDGHIFVDDHGIEQKAFHVLDGQGIRWLLQNGIEVAVISGRDSPSVTHRMEQLGIKYIYQGAVDKVPFYHELLKKLHLTDAQVSHVGDDLPDLPLINRVGLSIAVKNAVPQVKAKAHWVTENKGGKGAVREVCELLLRAQQHWDNLLKRYDA